MDRSRERFAFLASHYAGDGIDKLRSQIYDLGQSYEFPIWVAEIDEPDLKPQNGFAPFEIVDVCMSEVRASRNFIFVTDGTFGTALEDAKKKLASSYIEMELFQAAALEKSIHVYVVGGLEPGSQLGRLLEVLEFAFPANIHKTVRSYDDVLFAIERMLLREKKKQYSIPCLSG